jgi:low affinity Fe/Cu permease
MRPSKSTSWFTSFAKATARAAGRPVAFGLAVAVIVVWACFGPYFGWSDTHQLIINTSTTIVTFLMVFLIQNTQNRDTEALQVKLDELIRVTKGAHLALLDLEELDDKQLDKVRDTYEELAAKAREDIKRGKDDTGTPDLDDEGMNEALDEERGKPGKGKKRR